MSKDLQSILQYLDLHQEIIVLENLFFLSGHLRKVLLYTKIYDLDLGISLSFDIVTKYNIVWLMACALRASVFHKHITCF